MSTYPWQLHWKDYYHILEIDIEATEDDIKNSYRHLAGIHHSDKWEHAKEETRKWHEGRFKEIGEAYEVLTTQRTAYNLDWRQHDPSADMNGEAEDARRQAQDARDEAERIRKEADDRVRKAKAEGRSEAEAEFRQQQAESEAEEPEPEFEESGAEDEDYFDDVDDDEYEDELEEDEPAYDGQSRRGFALFGNGFAGLRKADKPAVAANFGGQALDGVFHIGRFVADVFWLSLVGAITGPIVSLIGMSFFDGLYHVEDGGTMAWVAVPGGIITMLLLGTVFHFTGKMRFFWAYPFLLLIICRMIYGQLG